jgi:hypothetical protein
MPPSFAAGYKLENLLQVKAAMEIDAVRAVLGSPLFERDGQADGDYLALWYAEPGATWTAGEYRSNVRGAECILWFKNGRLEEARIGNLSLERFCHCSIEACPERWAAPCFERDEGATSGHAG